jgi:hypothetical protein
LWLLYIALEPFVRRRWPQILVSWARLLSGGWCDPLIGRDVLVGCAAGVGMACLLRLTVWVPNVRGHPDATPGAGQLSALSGVSSVLSMLISGPLWAMAGVVPILFLLFLLRILLRSERVAAVGLVFILTALGVDTVPIWHSQAPWIVLPLTLMLEALTVFTLMRFGVLAVIVSTFVHLCFWNFPITLQISAWYSGIGYAVLFVVLAIALYGFRTSLGGRPLFDIASLED